MTVGASDKVNLNGRIDPFVKTEDEAIGIVCDEYTEDSSANDSATEDSAADDATEDSTDDEASDEDAAEESTEEEVSTDKEGVTVVKGSSFRSSLVQSNLKGRYLTEMG